MIAIGPLLVLLALLGAPLFVVIAASAMWGFTQEGIDLQAIVIEFYGMAEMPILLAIPLFTFAGYLLGESGAPRRLVRLTQALLGWMPAGLAIVSLATCAFFTAFTGASGVTIIAIGALLFPALQQAGYPEKFNLGLVTSAGSLGLLFAPSLPLILYGVIAEISIDDLFLAGLLPGFLMLLILSAYSVWKNRAVRVPLADFSWREVRSSVREAIWEIPLPVVVLGGIYSGYFAISEAAAVTALYVLIVDVLILREIPLRKLPEIMRESMMLVGGILVILGMSLASTNYMIDAGIPQKTAGIHQLPGHQPAEFPDAFVGFSAGAWRHPGYFLSHRAGGSADPSGRRAVWHSSGSPGHRIPGNHATGLPDPAGWAQSFYRQLPFRSLNCRALHCNAPVFPVPAAIRRHHCILAVAVTGAPQWLVFLTNGSHCLF